MRARQGVLFNYRGSLPSTVTEEEEGENQTKKTFSTKHDSWGQGPSSCLSLRGSCTPESAFESVSLCAPSPVTFRGHGVQCDSRGFSTSHVPGSNYSFALKLRKFTQWRPQKPEPGRTTQVEPMSSSSLWFSIYALGKAHNMRSTPSLRSFPNVASVSNSSNVRLIADDPLSSFRRARPLSTPLSSRRPMSSLYPRLQYNVVSHCPQCRGQQWLRWLRMWCNNNNGVSHDTPAGVMHRKFG